MPLHRDPGQIFCAHCVRARAETTCAACGQEICSPCAGDLDSCPAARAFEIRLGTGARLRLLSAGAELGLVSTLGRRLILIEPTRRRVLQRGGWSYRWRSGWAELGGISRRGELLRHGRTLQRRTAPSRAVSRELYLVDARIALPATARRAFFDRSERAVVSVLTTEILDIGWLSDPAERDRTPLARRQPLSPFAHRVIQAADFDAATGLVAAATFGAVTAVDLRGGEESGLGTAGPGHGDALWCAVAAGRIATLWEVPGPQRFNPSQELGVYALAGDGRLGREPIFSAVHKGGSSFQEPVVADISDDGRFVAAALHNRQIAVHDLETGELVRFEGHTDAVSTLRFGPGGKWLVSGDFDNRIIVRHRGPQGFAERLEPADLIDQPE